MILVQSTRDRPGGGLTLDESRVIALQLGERIAGRYMPKVEDRTERNQAAMRMFDGRNRDEVMRRFKISKRVFYRILSDHLRSKRSKAGKT